MHSIRALVSGPSSSWWRLVLNWGKRQSRQLPAGRPMADSRLLEKLERPECKGLGWLTVMSIGMWSEFETSIIFQSLGIRSTH